MAKRLDWEENNIQDKMKKNGTKSCDEGFYEDKETKIFKNKKRKKNYKSMIITNGESLHRVNKENYKKRKELIETRDSIIKSYDEGRRNFSDINLVNANLEGLYLPGINLQRSDMRGSNLKGINLVRC